MMPQLLRVDRGVEFAEGVLVFSCVRDEMLRLPFFLRHYRALGAVGFVMVDNGSEDGTGQFLRSQADVVLYHSASGFREAQSGIHWLRELIRDHAHGRWVIAVDADELFISPLADSPSIQVLVRRLEERGDEAISSLLLDMYSDRPFDETIPVPGRELWEVCPFFEISSINDLGVQQPPCAPAPMRSGGVRERLFEVGCCLDKVNLFRSGNGVVIHQGMHAISGARLSSMRTVTLHFKFLSDFRTRVHEAIQRREHWNEASEYKCYARGLARFPALSAISHRSLRFTSVEELARLGLVTTR